MAGGVFNSSTVVSAHLPAGFPHGNNHQSTDYIQFRTLKERDFALGRREATHNIFLNENDAEKEGDMVFQAES